MPLSFEAMVIDPSTLPFRLPVLKKGSAGSLAMATLPTGLFSTTVALPSFCSGISARVHLYASFPYRGDRGLTPVTGSAAALPAHATRAGRRLIRRMMDGSV